MDADGPPAGEPAIRVLAMPADTNAAGDIFGGWLMAQTDIAGSIEACRRARGRVVTVAVHEFRFLRPVYVGDLVSFHAHIVRVGNTSIRIHVSAWAERERQQHTIEQVAEAELTYVAIDSQRKPRPVPDTP